MKKRDLLLAGLVLCSVSAFADGPTSYPDDARVIFSQNFEGSANWSEIKLNEDPNRPTTLFTWQAEPVDSIKQVAYYKRNYDGTASGNPGSKTDIYDGSKQWEIAGIRDTTMLLYNGVLRTDAVQPDDSILSAQDQHFIKKYSDTPDVQSGGAAGAEYGLDRFGESGQAQYFVYRSGSSSGVANSSNGVVPEYRRNLFVRLNPGDIEDNSSYRVTVFVRGTKYATKSDAPTPQIGLDLMRGYFHSEKSFIQSLNTVKVKNAWGGESDEYVTFSDKTSYKINEGDEEGKWQKVTLMAYYSDDHVGNASPYLLGYYWADDWDWKTPINKTTGEVDVTSSDTAVLKFIQQPAKYFVRMSFRSDSTYFEVDNLSLTKSWIGGVEHYGDMLRVDFGYQTNLGDLAEAAKAKNKIAAVELPGEYFDVWALFHDDEENEDFWDRMDILSAEYQGDGYMYMWTKPFDNGMINSFEGAKKVLVTFRNPTDRPDLKLTYKGNYFPKGMDEEWVAAGKNVQDFHNEISALNPTIIYSKGKKVKSLKQLPPVCQREPYENGTFGLDPQTRQLTFKFSRQVYFDPAAVGENTNFTFVKVVGAGTTEYWKIKNYVDKNDTNTIIERPSSYSAPLSGDYVLTIDQVTHLDSADPTNPEDYGDDVVLNLHFGDFNVAPETKVEYFSNWRADITNYNDTNRPVPTSVYQHNGNDAFAKGSGENMGKCGFYPTKDDTLTIYGTKVPDNGMYYISNRTSGATGNLYSIVNFTKAGNFVINFKLAGHGSNNRPMGLKFYAKPAAELANGNDAGFAVLEAVTNKTVLEAGKKPEVNQSSYNLTTTWKDGTLTLAYPFTVAAPGEYVFEWTSTGASNYEGIAISNYWITTGGDLSLEYVNKVRTAISAAEERLGLADAGANNRYKGADYSNLNSLKTAAGSFIATKKASGVNKPSEYDAEAKALNDAANALKLHMDTVDAFFKAIDALNAKIALYDAATGADSLKPYAGFPELTQAKAFVASYDNFNFTIQGPGAIKAETDKVNAKIALIENRTTLAKSYLAAIAAATEAKDTAVVTTIPEYDALAAAITHAEGVDTVTSTFDELYAEVLAMAKAASNLVAQPFMESVTTARIKELDTLATDLGATIPANFATKIASIAFDDDEVAEVEKAAITVAIYDKINKSQKVDSIDLTPFVKNYYFYAQPRYTERTDYQMPKNADELSKPDFVRAAQIQHVQHQYNSGDLNGQAPIWVMILDQEFDDLIPGWTVKATAKDGGGNRMVTLGNSGYEDLKAYKPLFDASVGMDWNGRAEMSTEITGLPAGIYALSVDLVEQSGTGITLKAAPQGGTAVDGKIAAGKIKADNILVREGKIDVDLVLTSGNGWTRADNVKLLYIGKDDDPWFQQYYVKEGDDPILLKNAKKTLDKLATVVGASEAVAADVEYFSLGGVQLDAPIEGEVMLRKTTQNGEVIVEKVINK